MGRAQANCRRSMVRDSWVGVIRCDRKIFRENNTPKPASGEEPLQPLPLLNL